MKNHQCNVSLFIIFFSLLSFNSFSQSITADTTLANHYFDLARRFENKSMVDSAIFYAEKSQALNIRYFGEKSIKNANGLHLLGRLNFGKFKFDQALDYNFKALQIRKEILSENHIDLSKSYFNIGLVYYNKGVYDKSLENHLKALGIRIANYGETNPVVVISYMNIGNVYNAKGEYDKALENYVKALQIDREIVGEKNAEVALLYNNIGLVYYGKGEYDEALNYYFKALNTDMMLLGEKNLDVALFYSNIGNVYSIKGEFDLALEYYLKSLQIRKVILGEKHPLVAMNYLNIGYVFHNNTEFDKALEYYLMALQTNREIYGEKHPDVALCYMNIGNVYFNKGESDKALEYHFKALQIKKEILDEKDLDIASSYSNIGNVYFAKGENDKALEYHLKALNIDRVILGDKHVHVAGIENNIGIVYFNKGEYDKALEYYFNSLKIMRSIFGEKYTLVAGLYNNIGFAYEKTGEHEMAIENFQKGMASCLQNFNDTANIYSLPVIADILDWGYLMQALENKGQIIANKSKKLKGAESDYWKEIALNHYKACDTLIDITRKEISTLSDKLTLGEYASKCYKEAIDLLTSVQSDKNNRVAKSISGNDAELAFYFSEKNKSSVLLEALAGQEAIRFAGIPDSLIQKEKDLKMNINLYTKQLAEFENSGNKKTEQIRNSLFVSNRSYDSLIVVFEKEFPEYHNLKYNSKTVTVKDIQKLLDKKTGLRSYSIEDSSIVIFTLTRNKLNVQKVAKIPNLTDSIVWFRYGLTKTNPGMQQTFRRLSFKLYQQLFPKEALIDKQIENLIIIPDAELAMIPFESLLTSNYSGDINGYDQYPFLIKKYNISYSYSANLFNLTFNREASSTIEIQKLNDWLAIAPVFDNSTDQTSVISTRELQQQLRQLKTDSLLTNRSMFDRSYIASLPATETETESILKIYDENNLRAKAILHGDANEKFIKSGELENYRVVHFATHGFVNSEKPELSGLLLESDTNSGEDGILYSGEIYSLKLNAGLVVLSACETGLGKIQKGEGIIGLTRALLYAGARNIIVSLWQVADESTSDLMVDFYRYSLAAKGQLTYSDALRNAKLKMISEGKYAHPLYWSPFILIGK